MWHSHANEDELFLIIKGTIRIEFRDGIIDHVTIHVKDLLKSKNFYEKVFVPFDY